MSVEPELYIAAIIRSAGGQLVSRIRLQKIAYLLDKLQGTEKFHYSYHHYGPYSREIDNAILDAEAFNLIEERYERRKSDGAKYSIFRVKAHGLADDSCIAASNERLVQEFSKTNVTVLELAATAHWLAFEEKVDDWRSEIVHRKGSKIENGRLDEAVELLNRLGTHLP